MVRRIVENVNKRLAGYAVDYRDMGGAHHHLLKFKTEAAALDAYNKLIEACQDLDLGDIDEEVYYNIIDEVNTLALDAEYEIDFRRKVDKDNVYESPYDSKGRKEGEYPTYWKIVNPVAVDLEIFESLTEGKKKTAKKTTKKPTKKNSCKEQKLMEDSTNLVKITNKTARKLFDAGETIFLLPNKVRLGNAWIFPFAVNSNNSGGHSFDNIIDSYSYYNCNKEVGNSVAFYKEG